MRLERIARWYVPVFAAATIFGGPALPALGQAVNGTPIMISIDAPASGQSVMPGDQVDFGGWAADISAPASGVDKIEVVLDGLRGAGTSIGQASFGSARPDVASA